MKHKLLSSIKEVIKKDYSKSIIFDPSEFKQQGHLLQIVTIPPSTKQRTHHHTKQTEVFYVIEGECSIFINNNEYIAKPGDAFITDPGDTHNLWNKSKNPFKLIVFKIDYPENDDTKWQE